MNEQLRKVNYKSMIEAVSELIDNNGDFLFDMESKELPESSDYTQAEARQMSNLLGRIYLISHCTHCKACQSKWLEASTPGEASATNEMKEHS